MQSNRYTNQSGSVAVFLIVSVVLAAAVVGGIYFVQRRSDQVRTIPPVAQQSAPVTQQQNPDDTKKQDETKRQQEAAKQAEEAKKAAAEAQKQAAAKEQAAKDQAAKDAAQKQAAQKQATVPQTSTAPASNQPTATGNEHLPTTGPAEDALLQLIAAGIMIGLIGAYLKSYKHRFGSIIG